MLRRINICIVFVKICIHLIVSLQGLSNFDKVVGGLVWCLETCTYDVDVDLLFNEELKIGKKIALTEKIVNVLQTIQCPYKIEPHQIQGSDYINIFPVVQWLVKKAMETRDAMGDVIRKYAVSQYYRNFPETEPDLSAIQIEGLQSIRNGYEPKRKFRQKQKLELNKEGKVEMTLLEYGKSSAQSPIVHSDSNLTKSTSADIQKHTLDADRSKAQNYEDMMIDMEKEEKKNAKLNIKAVRNVMNSGDLTKASDQYALLQQKLIDERETENSPEGLNKAIQMLEKRTKFVRSRTQDIKVEINELQLEDTFRLKNEELSKVKDELAALEDDKRNIRLQEGDHERLKKLQSLMNKNETLKKKESEFRKVCKEKMGSMIAENDLIRREIDSLAAYTKDDLEASKIRSTHEERVDRLREELAHKSKVVSDLERKLDQIPSAYELAQYQRRFVELDQQVSSEYSETQKFVIMYNTLIDQKSFIEREVTLLESILENIPDMKYANSAAKSNFVDKLSRLHQGVEQSKTTMEKNMREYDKKRKEANDELNRLLDEQRQYSILVRDMKDEMRKNQILVDKIESM